MNKMFKNNGFISLNASNNFLKKEGYDFIETYRGSCQVDLMKKKDKKVIIKRDRVFLNYHQVINENLIYSSFGGHERMPKKIKFYNKLEGIMRGEDIEDILNFVSMQNVKKYILIKEYISGKEYENQQLSTAEEQKIIDLVKTFHKHNFAGLDIRNCNFIYTPNEELYFVDFGWAKKKFWNNINKKNQDWKNLERMFNKSLQK